MGTLIDKEGDIMEILTNFSFFTDPSSKWMLEIFLGLCSILAVHGIFSYYVKRASRKAEYSTLSWMQKIDGIILTPIKVVFLSLAAYYVLTILGDRFGLAGFAAAARPFISAILIACIGWTALRWKKEFVNSLRYDPRMVSAGLAHTLNKIVSMVIFILTSLVILQIFHVDIWPLLAFGGIGAAAVGFASKDVISNFCGGLMLSITRPFIIGDHIVLPSQNIEGPVEEIGWYQTILRDKEKRPVYLPNAIFSSVLVINNARMTHRRILEKIMVRFSDVARLKEILAQMRTIAKNSPVIDVSIEPLIHLNSFSESGAEVMIDIYVTTTELSQFHAGKENILFAFSDCIVKGGAKIAHHAVVLESEEGH